jgi:hypothetical protein
MFRVVTIWANKTYSGEIRYLEREKTFDRFREADRYLENACNLHNLVDWCIYEDTTKIACPYEAATKGYLTLVSEYFKNKKES